MYLYCPCTGPVGLDEWIALQDEKPIEPIADLPICDCHHHFFDMAAGGEAAKAFAQFPFWEPSFGVRNVLFKPLHSTGGVAEFSPPYLVEQLRADMQGNNVVSTVFEEAGFSYDTSVAKTNPVMMSVGEVVACQAIFDKHKGTAIEFCKGINGSVKFALGAAVEPALQEMCKHGIMRGIRDSCYTGVDKDKKAIPELMNHTQV